MKRRCVPAAFAIVIALTAVSAAHEAQRNTKKRMTPEPPPAPSGDAPN